MTDDNQENETGRYIGRLRCPQCKAVLDREPMSEYTDAPPDRAGRCEDHPWAKARWSVELTSDPE